MCAKHTMKVLSGIEPKQVNELMQKHKINMIQTNKGLLFEGELEDLRRAAKEIVDVTLPPGPTISEIKEAVEQCNVKLKQKDNGPQIHGSMNEINKTINILVDKLNERLSL